MFNCILVANRGEIACRVIETAQALGVRCIAVYSDVDAGAKHVAMADAAVRIGGPAPADSYLRADAIIAAARATGAEAIHPGYGFLSENPEFVEQVDAAGLVFIGPSAQAIRAMGLKDAAKALMIEAGVPVVPGYHGADQADAQLQQQADKIGYPVLIKAVAGGGGKGMRLVSAASEFTEALAAARSEAQAAFGNSDVLIEKFIPQPRHIEVQVFGDGTDVVHLFERDCSLQRRHQKVIEEAPAPGMTPEVREAMGRAAVRAAKAIGYKGAGTVEFIVDGTGDLRPDGFYFMEMNTRLQVEHPVTEAITGVDLVEWQLRVAAGEPLPCDQDGLAITGHAFEARLYAEDVRAGFLPATGTLHHLVFPAIARADSGVRAGDAISPYYDPMIAKLIVAGPTRAIALARLRRALKDTQVAGSVTNLEFLGALAAHEGFAAGAFDTGLIERDFATLTPAADPQIVHMVAAAMQVAGLDKPAAMAGFALWVQFAHQVRLGWQDQEHLLSVEVLDQHSQRWTHGDQSVTATRHAGQWSIDGAPLPLCHMSAGQVTVFDHYGLVFDIHDPLLAGATESGSGNLIEAPMPGLVKMLAAVPGQTVARGDRLAVLEAMKMEHALLAARDGIIAEVLAQEGDQVSAGAALIRLEEEQA
ncbi:biotin carboxylase N-terminal domain-containing protein [Roseobacter sp. OBYS 0001]|uniref:acetyl/propionyl/methylcrotonyl-CoA carboxylase subunit alpha n=1 Tax=Roseobacter sp. OBYS 0001 TaxID=882651 RepID=UPI0027E3F1D9|nr:biotin carboxylase N-terminal domain-containing protein [Roseobacter sp. OBYS 0001]